ncbi:MAG: kinase [Neobacillus sp.]
MEDFKSIRVSKKGENKVEVVHNPTSYPLIGTGKQGAVFKISSDRCVKIYANPNNVFKESKAYKATQGSPIIPKLYEVGENYIVLKYIEGSTLKQYLKSKGNITEDITQKILIMLEEMKRLKFAQLDSRLSNIIISEHEVLKVIDLVDAFKLSDDQSNRPESLMRGLNRLGLLPSFLEQVKKFDQQSYDRWKDFNSLKKRKIR